MKGFEGFFSPLQPLPTNKKAGRPWDGKRENGSDGSDPNRSASYSSAVAAASARPPSSHLPSQHPELAPPYGSSEDSLPSLNGNPENNRELRRRLIAGVTNGQPSTRPRAHQQENLHFEQRESPRKRWPARACLCRVCVCLAILALLGVIIVLRLVMSFKSGKSALPRPFRPVDFTDVSFAPPTSSSREGAPAPAPRVQDDYRSEEKESNLYVALDTMSGSPVKPPDTKSASSVKPTDTAPASPEEMADVISAPPASPEEVADVIPASSASPEEMANVISAPPASPEEVADVISASSASPEEVADVISAPPASPEEVADVIPAPSEKRPVVSTITEPPQAVTEIVDPAVDSADVNGGEAEELCWIFMYMERSGSASARQIATDYWRKGDLVYDTVQWRRGDSYAEGVMVSHWKFLHGGCVETLRNNEGRSCKWLTIFRHPVARLLSAYDHCRDAPKDPLCPPTGSTDVETFAERWGNFATRQFALSSVSPSAIKQWNARKKVPQGTSVWYLVKEYLSRGGASPEHVALGQDVLEDAKRTLSTYAAVGIAAEMDDTMHLFDKVLPMEDRGWSSSLRKLRRQNSEGDLQYDVAESTRFREALENPRIMSSLRFDMLLYDHAVQVFQEQLSHYGISSTL